MLMTCIIIVLTLLIIRQILAIADMFHSLNLCVNGMSIELDAAAEKPFVVLVIPLLREQKLLRETIDYLSALKYENHEILFVTTAKEKSEMGEDTTIDILRNLQGTYSFKWIHYPYEDGTKADQLNYAIERFEELFADREVQKSFLAFYDIDSRFHPRTLQYFAQIVKQNPGFNVFQQPSLYYNNIEGIGRCTKQQLVSLFLQAQAVRQTRFIFSYEIPRLINRLYYYEKRLSWRSALGAITYSHCVGHGLFVRASFALRNAFPSRETNEDMFYGFLLNCIKEPIKPFFVLDNCEMPSNIKTLLHQKARWFWGPARFLDYFKYVRDTFRDKGMVARARVIALFACYDALSWVLTSPIFAGLIALWGYEIFNLFSNKLSPQQAIVMAMLNIYILLYMAGILLLLVKFESTLSFSDMSRHYRLSSKRKLKILLAYPMVLLLHSLPAYYAIIDAILNGKKEILIFTKTERG